MTWSEFWHWMLLGEMSKNWMHLAMALFWLGVAALNYWGKPAPHRTEWLMFACWAFGVQCTLFLEKARP
jgi:hypothetical protein